MALPIAAGMLLQTLYFIVDLYFVSRLGDAALAGVSSGGNLMFVVFALTQMLGVGTVAMVSHAVGRKNQEEANHVFNQAVGLAAACTLLTLVGGYAITGPYMRFLGADAATVAAGVTFLQWLIPGLALQFAIVVMSSALRGTGIACPDVVQMLTVVVNAILAPILIAGGGRASRWVSLARAGDDTHPRRASWSSSSTSSSSSTTWRSTKQIRPKLKTWGTPHIGLPAGAVRAPGPVPGYVLGHARFRAAARQGSHRYASCR